MPRRSASAGPDCDKGRKRNQWRNREAVLEQRERHLGAGPEHETNGRRRDPQEHTLKRRDLTEPRVEQADQRHDDEWRPDQPDQRDTGPRTTPDATPKHDREVDHVGAGQELAQRVGIVELLGRHPLALLDQHAPRPGEHPAKAAQRDQGKGDEEFEQRGRCGRRCAWRGRRDRLGHGAELARGGRPTKRFVGKLPRMAKPVVKPVSGQAGPAVGRLFFHQPSASILRGAGASRLWR